MSKAYPKIVIDDESYQASGKLADKVVVITGGDSGIGAATALLCAKEGALVAINYLDEEKDARHVVSLIEERGGRAMCLQGDLREKENCQILIQQVVEHFDSIDVIINNAGTQVEQKKIGDISQEQLYDTFQTNIFSMFYVTQAALPFMQPHSSIINTTSITAYRGSEELLDYSAAKGAIVSLTRSLSQNLAVVPIRVNAVAPGPVWTPLVLSSFDEEKLDAFGKSQPLGRAAQPIEIAPAYVFLASRDARYMTGQVLHVNGGEVING